MMARDGLVETVAVGIKYIQIHVALICVNDIMYILLTPGASIIMLKSLIFISCSFLPLISCGSFLVGKIRPEKNPGKPPVVGKSQHDGVYLDVFSLHDGARVPVGKWPSQLRQGELMDACSTGKIFYSDYCWESMIIDINKQEVTFLSESGAVAKITTSQPIPSHLGTLTKIPKNQDVLSFNLFSQQKLNSGYLRSGECLNSFSDAKYEISTWDIWGGINLLEFGWREAPTFATPWATSRCFTTYSKNPLEVSENLLSFGVKTTFLFGAIEAKSKPGGIALAHSWPYKGTIRIGTTNLELPVSLDKVSEVSESPIDERGCVVMGSLYNGRSTLCAIDGVLQVRRSYGGLPDEPRNITDVSFIGPSPLKDGDLSNEN